MMILIACSPEAQAHLPIPTVSIPTSLPTATPTHIPLTPGATEAPSQLPTPTVELSPICSPLDGIGLSELPQIITNPFASPHPGADDGHHGIDLAFYRYKDRVGMQGLPVHSVLSGKIVGETTDRPPYGNMVIVETPLTALSPAWVASLDQLSLATPAPPDSRLTCPSMPLPLAQTGSGLSLYLLYAHMESPPPFRTGDPVGCGDPLGAVGNTGNSGNPHLHFEVRLGPGETTLGAMSHYDTSATEDEMAAYCLWRVSGKYRLVDPTFLIGANFAR